MSPAHPKAQRTVNSDWLVFQKDARIGTFGGLHRWGGFVPRSRHHHLERGLTSPEIFAGDIATQIVDDPGSIPGGLFDSGHRRKGFGTGIKRPGDPEPCFADQLISGLAEASTVNDGLGETPGLCGLHPRLQ